MTIKGAWSCLNNGITEKLFENQKGEYILWECIIPLASGKICTNQTRSYSGFGYVERLTCTIKPWDMPITNLKWGRYLTQHHWVIWIHWTGETKKLLIFYNNMKFTDGFVDDNELLFGDFRLALKEKYILRNGKLGETVFKQFKNLKEIFKNGILNLKECKWQTKSELYLNDEKISEGWSIHENVEWKENIIGKVFYGGFFTVILPIILTFWSKMTESYIKLPIPEATAFSLLLIFTGLILMLTSILYLWIFGEGLPMNAYPPKYYVTIGPYRLFSHPIYIGSSLISFGCAIFFQSKSGFLAFQYLLYRGLHLYTALKIMI